MRPARLVFLIWFSFICGIAAISLWVMAVSGDWLGLFGGMPGTENLTNPKKELASVVYTEDGIELGKYFTENRSEVDFNKISPNLIKTLYATEDIRFDQHSGIDMKGTFAIIWYLIKQDKRGSSTITQQLAKNLFSTRSEAYEGKLGSVPGLSKIIIKTKEWITAVKLEKTYTKKEILTMYLNTVDFGSNAFGIQTAARTFFSTTPDKLTIPESAVLVGLLKAPTLYSPIYNPKRAEARRNTVLGQLYKYKFITKEEFELYKSQPIDMSRYRVESHNDGTGTYFRAEIKKDLLKFCKENGYDLFRDGLKIYTTINYRMQRYAEQAVDSHMRNLQAKFFKYWKGRNPWVDENGKEIPGFIETAARRTSLYQQYLAQYNGNADSAMLAFKTPVRTQLFSYDRIIDTLISPYDSIRYTKHFLHCGFMSMDPYNGHIKAWVGGINFRFFKYDHVRQGKRQPGSAFKPILYATAIDNGYTPCVEMVDAPVTFYNEETNTYWTPKNSDGKYSGERMTLRRALAQSINTVAANLIKKMGPERVVEYARKLGIESPLDPVPALCLGSSDVSVFELVGAYSTFVAGGTYTKPFYITKIMDKNGALIKEFNPEKREVLSEETAYTMVYMLQGATTEKNGTALGLYRLGNTLRGGNEVAAKTGTTSNYSDGWFVGCTKDLVTGIWVGGEDRCIHFRSFDLGQGSRMAMPIWSYYMDKVYSDPTLGITKGQFKRPANYSIELNCQLANNGHYITDSTTSTLPQKPSGKNLDD
jgi:penicillin-binding protein 1A